MKIGVLGGTGTEGKGLALRFARAGAEILIGSRSAERAEACARQYAALAGTAAIRGLENSRMLAEADIVFLTVPWEDACAAVHSARDFLRAGQVIVDVTVPVRFRNRRAEYVDVEEGSNAERIARHVPDGVGLVAAFKTEPAELLADLDQKLDCDVFVASDSETAKGAVIEAVRSLQDPRPVDAGPLSASRTLERMTVLAINLNRRYRRKGARFRIPGI